MKNLWFENIKNKKMIEVLKVAENISPHKSTVMIYGESGVGKELMARYIHEKSYRKSGPFVAINCAAVPENLLESELFGYEKGAFTGAVQSKKGKFELAHKGTFLLDEISEMPLSLQGKILRVLQEAEVERLGGTESKKIDVRFVCTSNKDLSDMIVKKKFRQDLFYRLNVIPLNIPPLRHRKEDISNLVHYFLSRVSKENNTEIRKISKEALNKIYSWSWPGNIRELQNTVERSSLMSSSSILKSSDIFIEEKVFENTKNLNFLCPGMSLEEAEKRLIEKTLEYTKKNRTQAAQILGITVRTLRNKLNRYNTKSIHF